MAARKESSLETQLAKRGFESVSVTRPMAAGEVKVEATKLHRLPTAGEEPVYAQIPVSLSVKLDKSGRIQSIKGDTPSDNAVKDAVHFLNGLRERGEVVDEASPPTPTPDQNGRASAPRPPHQIVRDEQGRQVLRRRRISMV